MVIEEIYCGDAMVLEQIHRQDALPPKARDYTHDTLTLGWDDRLRARGRRRSDGGVAFDLSLPRGTILRGGDCLVLDEAKMVVVVVERPEPVFLIEPRTHQDWGLFAYHIGNRHLPLMITEAGIVCPDVAGVEQLLEQQCIPFARATLAFTPATSVAHHHD
jgi:urease accessory protein